MCDALQELSELSLELQSRDITLYSAHQKIENQIMVSEDRKLYYNEALKAKEKLKFREILLQLIEVQKVTVLTQINFTSSETMNGDISTEKRGHLHSTMCQSVGLLNLAR